MTTSLRHIVYGIFFPLALAIHCGCSSGGGESVVEQNRKFHKALIDSLSTSHLKGASLLVERQKQEARDSFDYYMAMGNGLVVDYYLGNGRHLREATDSILRFLSREKTDLPATYLRARVYNTLGAYYTRMEFNPDSNIHYYTKALEMYKTVGTPADLVDAYINLGSAAKDNGDYPRSADYYGRGLMVADSAGLDNNHRVALTSGLATVYTALRDFDQSAEWWDRAARLQPAMSYSDLFFYLNNRGNDAYLKGDYPQSLRYFLSLDSVLNSLPEMEWERYFCRTNLVDVYLRLDSLDKARALIEGNDHFFSEVQPSAYVMEHIDTQRLQLYMKSGRYDLVEAMIRKWNAPEAQSRPEQQMERLEFLNDYYARTSQWNKAYAAQQSFHAYEDSLRNAQTHMSAMERQMRYERDASVVSLRKDIQVHHHMRVLYFLIIVASIIIIIILTIVIIMRRRMAADREERLLHNIVGLRMNALRSKITPHFIYNALNHEIAARQEGQPSNLDALVGLLRHQQFMADELAVPMADDIAFVDEYVKVERARFDSRLSYVTTIDPAIPLDTTLVPSMVVQIFVENAFKHGFASLPIGVERILKIDVSQTPDAIVISVCNNAGEALAGGNESTRKGLKIVAGTLQILNERKPRPITFELLPWTDNPQRSGCCVVLTIPNNFNFEINGRFSRAR